MTEAELGKRMLKHARRENKRATLPHNQAPLRPLSDTVLQVCARDGGVMRRNELSAATGFAAQAITEAQRVLMGRNFIRRVGEKRESVLHATDTGRAVLRDAGMEVANV